MSRTASSASTSFPSAKRPSSIPGSPQRASERAASCRSSSVAVASVMQSLDEDVADNAAPEPEILHGSLSGYLVKVRPVGEVSHGLAFAGGGRSPYLLWGDRSVPRKVHHISLFYRQGIPWSTPRSSRFPGSKPVRLRARFAHAQLKVQPVFDQGEATNVSHLASPIHVLDPRRVGRPVRARRPR